MRSKFIFAAVWLLLAFSAAAQTLTFSNSVQNYASLTNTTVTMTGRCELRVSAASNPIPGCTINLNSSNAWVFFTSIKPSVVAASYLGQIFVNGSAAVADSNVRVVQYAGNGTVVIPQPPTFQPLQVFSGPHFTGISSNLSQYVYYTGTGLGALDVNISSFKLKRGYQAVVALNTVGSSYSKCYVAADGDLEVSLLPSSLDNKIRFIYVTPWRWSGKKAIAGDPGIGLLNVGSWYNWNLDQNSSRDVEYVAIRAQRYWPGLGQDWKSRGVNTVLGYNEPDSTAQANILVGDAIYSWPDLLGTGLRVGSPAPTDGGRSSWLYPFITQADAAGLRVDFCAVHYYQSHNPADAAGCASQLYNFLLDVWNNTHRPIWLTEWNNGANWTDGQWPVPTYAQQQACVSAMITMLETTPFVERYNLYNWVENGRAVTTNGVLTAAGVTYRDKVSAIAYTQTLPDNAYRSYAQLTFETNTLDSSGYGNNALPVGAPAFVAGRVGQAIALDGTNNYLQLTPTLGNATTFSFAAWVNWSGGAQWQRIFDFGNDTTHYLFLSPSSGGNTLRFAINNGSGEQLVETSPLIAGQWRHVALTLSNNVCKLYTNGVLASTSSSFSIAPSAFKPVFNYLGKSTFAADPLFRGNLDEVLITDFALSAAQILALQTNVPPQFSTNQLARGTVTIGQSYSTNMTGTATDANPGDPLTYTKAIGAAWLNVSASGVLTGTPAAADAGTNYFTVRAVDSSGMNAFTLLTVNVIVTNTAGVWGVNADGNWSDAVNWTGGNVAGGIGFSADFSTLNITADRTVNLDGSRTVGTLKFSDTIGSSKWIVSSTNGAALTLDTGSATSPLITVTNTATIAASVGGLNGFTKTGPGTLILSGANSISGTLNVDTAQPSSGNDGIVRLANPDAASSLSAINIRNQNAASSILQLDGSNGGVFAPAPIALNGRTAFTAAIQNISGTNTLGGNVTINTGGGNYWIQSDAGQLNFGGNFSSAATGTRTFTFQGAGNIAVSGGIANGSASAINVTKTGGGTLTLGGTNTFTGTLTVNNGRLIVDGVVNTLNVAAGILGGSGLINGAVNLPAGSTLTPGAPLASTNSGGTLTFSNSLTLQPGSTTLVKLDKTFSTNDQLTVSGALIYDGTLAVTNLNTVLAGGDTFRIFNAPNSTGNFSAVTLSPAAGVAGKFNPTNGVLTIFSTVPPNLGALVTGNALQLSWPSDHLGWRLQVQTNDLASGLGTNWSDVAGSPQTNAVNVLIDPAGGNVFYRMIFP